MTDGGSVLIHALPFAVVWEPQVLLAADLTLVTKKVTSEGSAAPRFAHGKERGHQDEARRAHVVILRGLSLLNYSVAGLVSVWARADADGVIGRARHVLATLA
jgi:hypothetical protein